MLPAPAVGCPSVPVGLSIWRTNRWNARRRPAEANDMHLFGSIAVRKQLKKRQQLPKCLTGATLRTCLAVLRARSEDQENNLGEVLTGVAGLAPGSRVARIISASSFPVPFLLPAFA